MTVIPAYTSSAEAASDIHRKIVICFDGTNDQYDDTNSNVVKFFAALKKDDPRQLCYYHVGIGTYTSLFGGCLKYGASAILDMAVGYSLGQHVRDAYCFLMQHYKEGDKICLLGFSRGAYTARALAGMLYKVGLLPANNEVQVQFAYKWFKDDSPTGWKMSVDFKKTFSIDVAVHFLGCWDTVASVGIIPRYLPFSNTSNEVVVHFRHALALDERRTRFQANQWFGKDEHPPSVIVKEVKPQLGEKRQQKQPLLGPNFVQPGLRDDRYPAEDNYLIASGISQSKLQQEFRKSEAAHFGADDQPTNILEVWFLGSHSDCGGGAVSNHTLNQLSRIPLRWMIRQTFACNTGLLYHSDVLEAHGMDVESLSPVLLENVGRVPKAMIATIPSPISQVRQDFNTQSSMAPCSTSLASQIKGLFFSSPKVTTHKESQVKLPEHYEDYFDSISPTHDELKLQWLWWILEFLPSRFLIRSKQFGWTERIGFHIGRHRAIVDQQPSIHWTVDEQIKAGNYQIKSMTEQDVQWKIAH